MKPKSYFIHAPSISELHTIETLYSTIKLGKIQQIQQCLMDIPNHSSFERINYYFFERYTFTIVDGIRSFQEEEKRDVLNTCLKISGLNAF